MSSSRSARIFLSSTFRDFGEERDLLVRRVFPALRARLKDRFVELVDVDLRWGITAEQAERGEVLPICLAEIDRARPYFVGMLGERYGWIPPSDGYALDLLERHAWLHDHRGGKSVTELEILHGVLNDPKMAGRAFFYFRSADYAAAKGGDYVPTLEDDRLRQKDLKDRIRESGFPVVEDYPTPEAFATKLEEDLWKILDEAFPEDQIPDAFERESRRHEAYAIPRRRLYLGGEAYAQALTHYLEVGAQRILIEGQSGGGKSALIANWLQSYADSHPDAVIFEHYTAASADAADSVSLVRRLIEHIKRATGSSEELPADPEKLLESLPLWFANASAWGSKEGKHWVFTIDALNGLSNRRDLSWFPEFLPERVHLVISCLPSEVMDALITKGDWQRLLVNPLTADECRHLLTAYLARYNKTLTDELTQKALSHPLSSNPLFLRTLAEELRIFGVYEQLKERLDHYLESQTVDDLFERVLERVEGDCGQREVQASMEAIWASRAGLAEQEIQKLCNLAPVEWATIRAALDDVLIDSAGRITFAHDYLRIAISDRYLKGNNTLDDETQSDEAKALRQNLHARIANWFEEEFLSGIETTQVSVKDGSSISDSEPTDVKPQSTETISAARASEEIPHQWQQAQNWERLKAALTNKDIVEAVYDNRSIQELLSYWLELETEAKADVEREYEQAWDNWKIDKNSISTSHLCYKLNNFFLFAGRYNIPLTSKLERCSVWLQEIEYKNVNLIANINLNITEFYRGVANYNKAKEKLDFLIKLKISDPEIKSNIYQKYAQLNCTIGNFDQSNKFFKRAINQKIKILGPINETVFNIQRELAWNLYSSGQYQNSLSANLKIMDRYKNIRNYDQFEYAALLNNIGLIHYNIGNLKEAEKFFLDEERIFKKYLGENNWPNALSTINRAWLKEIQNQFEIAAANYNFARSKLENYFSKNHPTIALIEGSLAWNKHKTGNFYQAQKHYQTSIDIYSNILDDNHIDNMINYDGLGVLQMEKAEYSLASKYLKISERICTLNFGDDHPNLSITSSYIATLNFFEKNYEEAFILDRKAFSILMKKKSQNDLDMARVANGYATSLFLNSYFSEALNLQIYAVKIFNRSLGTIHPDTVLAKSNLDLMNELYLEIHNTKRNKVSKLEFLSKLEHLPYRKNKVIDLGDSENFKRLFKTRRYMGSSTM
jgi:nephrocystin-3